MKKKAIVILPNQLFEEHPLLEKDIPIYLIESERHFTDFKFHKQKLILHRASMKYYEHYLQQKGYIVHYIPFYELSTIWQALIKSNVKSIHICDPVDHFLETTLQDQCFKYRLELVMYDSPQFLTTRSLAADMLSNKKHYSMSSFYISQRKRLNILIKNNKPLGGKWSFDTQNRKRISPLLKIPKLPTPKKNAWVNEAQDYVQKHFVHNYGSSAPFFYPITFKQAQKWFDEFLNHRLHLFGDYQDAIDTQEPFLFHSLLSPLLNIGLLTPTYVVEKTLKHAQKCSTPLNSFEGFIRQIIGWREFVRAVYSVKGEHQRSSNFFGNKRKLPHSFWTGSTQIKPLDTVIQKIVKTGYAHHIERLMILGNWMLICEYDPNNVYQWFMELFIDSYDWVMVPNVYGMSQYADGGLMTTKPYLSSSKYILLMSNYSRESWCDLWDSLYWNFIATNAKKLTSPRMKATMAYLQRASPSAIKKHKQRAQGYLQSLETEQSSSSNGRK